MKTKRALDLSRRIKQLAEQNQELLAAFHQLNRGEQLPQRGRKERVTFTIDLELMKTFRSYCGRQGWKMSTIIEKALRKELEKGSEK